MSIVLFVSSSVFGSGLSSSVSDGLDPSEVDVLYWSDGTTSRLTYDIEMLKPEVSEITLVNVYAADPEKRTEKSSVQIGGKIDEKPFGIGEFHGSYGVLLLYPERARVPEVFDDTMFYFKASDYETMITGIRQVIEENTWSSGGIHDYVDREKEKRDMVLLAKVFSYGFITLISLISIANVFHTISTNIALRRRDFAMLRSVGMSTRKLRRMLYYECLLYGSKALLYGLPLSVCMAAFIHHITDNIVISVFNFPWIPMGIASLGVFAVVFVTMMYAMSKMKRDNPMDSLKNENI